MAVTATDVEAAIRLLLGRESDAREVEGVLALRFDRAGLCRHLLASEEFESMHPDLARHSSAAPVIVPLADGVRIVVDLADHAIGLPIARRTFELNELDFVRRTVKSGWHVIDGGAHAGLYALTMARLVGPWGSVHAFEPVEQHVAWLEQGVDESGVRDVVRIVRAALSSSRGRARLVCPAGICNSNVARLLGPDERGPSSWRVDTVPTVAIDEVDVPRPVSFIRLDVEGAEALALEGADRVLHEDRPVVLAEIHATLMPLVSGRTVEGLVDRMRSLRYTAHALGAGVPGPALSHAVAGGVASMVFLP